MTKIKSDDESPSGGEAVKLKEKPHKQPMICLFDFEEDVEEELKKLQFNFITATFGSTIEVKNKLDEQKYLKLNCKFPNNLHEFDIVMLDITSNKSISYHPDQHTFTNTSGLNDLVLLSNYPQQVFDPRPLSISLFSSQIDELLAKKKSIIIAFCSEQITSVYQPVVITSYENKLNSKYSCSNLKFYSDFPESKNRCGRMVKIPEKKSKLSPLLREHLDGIEYRTIFIHPSHYMTTGYKKDESFFPLLINELDEIVSYSYLRGDSLVLVFPDINDKASFIASLFKTYLPEMMPEIFPFHGEFGWLESGDYLLPGQSKLLQEKTDIEDKYVKDIAENDALMLKLKEDFKFLSDLISETGDTLVSAVMQYLKWLEFESVVNFDDTNPDTLEEDIQVDCGDRFLVIEVKGIGGTSKDTDCSQISKIRYRRSKERGKFDVYGLYIVNHQRYLPPKSRSNPPFTENQIKDASHDERGLLTTYDLYKAYFLIEDGILQKSDVRESLFKTGLITLEPENIVSIGFPSELLKNDQVAILNLNNITLSVNDTLVIKKQDDYSKAIIESLQVDDESVSSCSNGEVGIKLDKRLKKNSELFVKKV